jgi:GT2 family glycosyltransferase
VVRAFNRGYEAAAGLDYDFIVKLDCDLSFEPDYFEKLLTRMLAEPQLGIASGVYIEAADGVTWKEIGMPSYHACGASKVIRRECFEQMGGFIAARGWDTVDEIRAMARGWRTTHFPELKMQHWKPEGTGIGSMRTNYMHGEIYYVTGGGPFFFFFKVLHRLAQRPFLIAGAALFWGYLRTMCSGKQRLVTREEAACYRALLNGRITGKFKRGGGPQPEAAV